MTDITPTPALPEDNPLAAPSELPYGLPDFAALSDAQLADALRAGMAEQRAELEAIVGTDASADFENTVRALELSGRLLHRARAVLMTLLSLIHI